MIGSLQLKKNFTLRPATMDDLDGVLKLLAACAIKVIGETDDSREELQSEWQSPGFDQARNQRVIFAPTGELIGFATVDDSRAIAPFVDIYTHPDYEHEGVDEYLIAWAESLAREAISEAPEGARVVMRAATYEQDRWYRGLLEGAGLHPVRHFWRMRIPLLTAPAEQPVWPEGITVRTVSPDEDLRPILQAQRDFFKDHWGQSETPFDEHYERWLHEWQSNGELDRSLWFIAMEGDQIAGISLCRPKSEDPQVGWVSTLGVLRAFRQRGIGRALLLHSFGDFYRRGLKHAGLGVDASSLTGATRLYESVGMQVEQQINVYEKELRPGVDLMTQEIGD